MQLSLGPEFWQTEKNTLLSVLLPHVQAAAIGGANAAGDKLTVAGFAFDGSLGHAEAARWAREHTDKVLEDLGTTTEKVVGEMVANWYAAGGDLAQLRDGLAMVLDANASRAAMIAITEVTRAGAEGETIVYEAAGVPRVVFKPPAHPRCRCWTAVKRLPNGEYVAVWLTNRDEIVCKQSIDTPWGSVDGCRGLDNVVISEGPYLGLKVSEAAQRAKGG